MIKWFSKILDYPADKIYAVIVSIINIFKKLISSIKKRFEPAPTVKSMEYKEYRIESKPKPRVRRLNIARNTTVIGSRSRVNFPDRFAGVVTDRYDSISDLAQALQEENPLVDIDTLLKVASSIIEERKMEDEVFKLR